MVYNVLRAAGFSYQGLHRPQIYSILSEFLTRYKESRFGCGERVLEQTKVFPNAYLYTASLYSAMGLPQELFTPIFAISRIVGWTSHILEQWSNNRLIRPDDNILPFLENAR